MTFKFNKAGLKSILWSGWLIATLAVSGCATPAVQYKTGNMGERADSTLRPQAAPLDIAGPLDIDQVRTRTLMHNTMAHGGIIPAHPLV